MLTKITKYALATSSRVPYSCCTILDFKMISRLRELAVTLVIATSLNLEITLSPMQYCTEWLVKV